MSCPHINPQPLPRLSMSQVHRNLAAACSFRGPPSPAPVQRQALPHPQSAAAAPALLDLDTVPSSISNPFRDESFLGDAQQSSAQPVHHSAVAPQQQTTHSPHDASLDPFSSVPLSEDKGQWAPWAVHTQPAHNRQGSCSAEQSAASWQQQQTPWQGAAASPRAVAPSC